MACILLAAANLGACRSPEQKAQKADAWYAFAMAQGDLRTAKAAMLKATAAKDDVPQYWLQLAKTEMALSQYDEAYYAYSRASELDRSNPEALQALADISVMSGRPDDAIRYADQVLLLQPGTYPPLLTKGYVALRTGKLDDAIKQADSVLAMAPGEINATILKSRALAARGDIAQASALLEKQLAGSVAPNIVLGALLNIYEHVQDKPNIAKTRGRLAALDPDNRSLTLAYATALYDVGQGAAARNQVLGLLDSTTSGAELSKILSLWGRSEPRAWAIAQVKERAKASPSGLQVVYAQFLIYAGAPADGEALLDPLVSLPVTARNANALALLARAQSDQGRPADALPLLNKIIAFDQGNSIALRARADLNLRAGKARDAQWDCEHLIAANPQNPDDRMRLVRTYQAMGRVDLADATLWRALNDIPGDQGLHSKARAYFAARNQPASIARVDQISADQHALEQSRW